MRDIMGLMKQAQAMQQKLQDAQAELETVEVEGTSGGGVVTVKVTGKGQLKAISIDASLMNPDEKEILEDLIVAAMNDAKGKADRAAEERMAALTKGLPIPPGMKLF
ncbi:YbaB/EbfC family nucleoid-associated protein [Microvirga pudoricolor]|uniref:YbaB/EbfC family nucleoid-associated protein n=1 Tax=Microvirga pudoricolor TaxID=2778729 RepID=UPI001951C0B7|nr:YbaB/EbfC family nucleoid-associated protein [Microvirga pudoricolor]MBM6596203.1 YbaB/EbfC family nucleoid-associated protein [Microvirga pudoricolor]